MSKWRDFGFSLKRAYKNGQISSQKNFEFFVYRFFPEAEEEGKESLKEYIPLFSKAREAVAQDLARERIDFDAEFYVAPVPFEGYFFVLPDPPDATRDIFMFTFPSSLSEERSEPQKFYDGAWTALHEAAHVGMKYAGANTYDPVVDEAIPNLFASSTLAGHAQLDTQREFCEESLPKRDGVPFFDFEGEYREKTLDALSKLEKEQLAGVFVNSVSSVYMERHSPRRVKNYLHAMRALQAPTLQHYNEGNSLLSVGKKIEAQLFLGRLAYLSDESAR